MPVLAIRAADDRLSSESWVCDLARRAPDDSDHVSVPGAHAFVWLDPSAWSEPLRRLADRAGSALR